MESIESRKKRKPKTPVKFNIELNEEQKEAKEIILNSAVSLIVGGPGSGKSLCASYVALYEFVNKQVGQIVIIRPIVPAADDIGFLPGSKEEKMEPWTAAIIANMEQCRDKKEIKEMLDSGRIQMLPLAYARSITFTDSVIIVDEAQNLTLENLKLILGRLGTTSRLIFTGDIGQIDLKRKKDSSLRFFEKLSSVEGVSIIELKGNHRHPLVPQLLEILDDLKTENGTISST